jgi:hypothetical protein
MSRITFCYEKFSLGHHFLGYYRYRGQTFLKPIMYLLESFVCIGITYLRSINFVCIIVAHIVLFILDNIVHGEMLFHGDIIVLVNSH